jgi:hypothetical protein
MPKKIKESTLQLLKKKVKKPRTGTKKPKLTGPKDKSVKQNVNVNVTSSGGGGSGGTSIPSSQPYQYYNPSAPSLANKMREAERQGENVQLKKLTDLLSKSIQQQTPVPPMRKEEEFSETQSIDPEEFNKLFIRQGRSSESSSERKTYPLFEGENINVPSSIKSKSSGVNKTLLERINTTDAEDQSTVINNNDIIDESLLVNNKDIVFERKVPRIYSELEDIFSNSGLEKNKNKLIKELNLINSNL